MYVKCKSLFWFLIIWYCVTIHTNTMSVKCQLNLSVSHFLCIWCNLNCTTHHSGSDAATPGCMGVLCWVITCDVFITLAVSPTQKFWPGAPYGAPYSGDWNFRQCFYAFWYLGHSWPFGKNFYGDRPRGTPPSGELNTRGVAECSDFGPIDGYISETVQDRS